ncbi:MAG: isocitrate lyase/PEP mutase family protein [Alphaproteobacteria bacterium]
MNIAPTVAGGGLSGLLAGPEILVAPGCYDALTGLLVEEAGFEAAYLSGASIAYARLGRPDIGLVGMDEVAATLAAIRERISIPLIVDADTGFGNALNVMRAVKLFERLGASAIQLEDQSLPKRCGHLGDKSLVSCGEMEGKIKAALDARASEATLIIARTDAIAVEGFEAALTRAERYREAGADVLFVEAPRSAEDMQALVQRLGPDIPLMANMVEGGKTPAISAEGLQEIGFSLVIFPGGTVRAVAKNLRDYFASLRRHGTTGPSRQSMLDFNELQQLVGTDELLAAGKRYEEPEN